MKKQEKKKRKWLVNRSTHGAINLFLNELIYY